MVKRVSKTEWVDTPKKIVVEWFQASDGKEFSTREEAERYEQEVLPAWEVMVRSWPKVEDGEEEWLYFSDDENLAYFRDAAKKAGWHEHAYAADARFSSIPDDYPLFGKFNYEETDQGRPSHHFTWVTARDLNAMASLAGFTFTRGLLTCRDGVQ